MKLPLSTDLALAETVVVLAEARTGSSLLMQTLRLLGKTVVGTADRANLDSIANPRGYYEQPDILVRGLYAPPLRQNPALLRGRAVKIAVRPLVRRASEDAGAEWRTLVESKATLVLSIRHPAESIASREIFAPEALTNGQNVISPPAAVSIALLNLKFLALQLGSATAIPARVACIDYAIAIADPSRYLDKVIESCKLTPTPSQYKAALANISDALYRYRLNEISDEIRILVQQSGLDRIYEKLRSGAPDAWTSVAQELSQPPHTEILR